MWPSRTRVVSAASAESAVNDSKVISSVGLGTVWKWSKSQIDSKPSRSASFATPAVLAQAAFGSHPSNSPVHPWGTITPTFNPTPPRTGFQGVHGGPCSALQRRARRPSGAPSTPAPSTSDDHLFPGWADRDMRYRYARQSLEALDIRPRRSRQVSPRARQGGIGLPSIELLVDRLQPAIDRCRCRHRLPLRVGDRIAVRGAHADALEGIEDVELGERHR